MAAQAARRVLYAWSITNSYLNGAALFVKAGGLVKQMIESTVVELSESLREEPEAPGVPGAGVEAVGHWRSTQLTTGSGLGL